MQVRESHIESAIIGMWRMGADIYDIAGALIHQVPVNTGITMEHYCEQVINEYNIILKNRK